MSAIRTELGIRISVIHLRPDLCLPSADSAALRETSDSETSDQGLPPRSHQGGDRLRHAVDILIIERGHANAPTVHGIDRILRF